MNSDQTRRVDLGGALTALITPFDPQGRVDRDRLRRLAAWQVDRGIDGLVPCGTTGEAATLSDDEKAEVVSIVVEAIDGRVPVVAGCGTNATRTTVEGAKSCARAGADALLVVTPYYNKPNATGMVQHFEAVAEATELPVVAYNVPGRTGQNLGVDLTLRLAQIPGVVGVKEASADLVQISAILQGRPEGFVVLSGDDPLTLPTVALGAEGVISVVANEAPREMAELVRSARSDDLDAARRIHHRLFSLMQANFVESNPVPVKAAMHLLGHCELVLRPPLGAPASSTVERMRRALQQAGIEGAGG
jgi:4-hydroxy-tetrahydrodipicolinate synthase